MFLQELDQTNLILVILDDESCLYILIRVTGKIFQASHDSPELIRIAPARGLRQVAKGLQGVASVRCLLCVPGLRLQAADDPPRFRNLGSCAGVYLEDQGT